MLSTKTIPRSVYKYKKSTQLLLQSQTGLE